MTVDAGKMDPGVVMRALAAEGIEAQLSADGRRVLWPNHEYNADTGKVSARESYASKEEEVSELKMRYSRQIVTEQAKKFGWTLQSTGNNKFKVIKR